MRRTLTIACVTCLAIAPAPSRAQTPETIFVSATYADPGFTEIGAHAYNYQWTGVRFSTTERYKITRIGGHMGRNFNGTIFVAVFPASATEVGDEALLANAVFVKDMFVGHPWAEYSISTESDDLFLDPGDWAIIFGATEPGNAHHVILPTTGQDDIGSPHYLRAYGSSGHLFWQPEAGNRFRIFVEGNSEPVCGNGTLEPEIGEVCDDGGESATCDSDCTAVSCGDGKPNSAAGETCDDGNVNATDGCSNCSVVSGWSCEGAPSVCSSTCGDGMIVGIEVCDDRNISSGDGCNASCSAVEPGFACDGAPSVCTTTCGDGIVAGTETCDDQNAVLTDGCAACQRSAGWVCTGAPSVCDTVCGDGLVAGIEACDDRGDSAECDRDCTFAVCGDELVNPAAGEGCDDGNSDDEDGCRNNCVSGTCGDGEVQSEVEQCDDGPFNSDSNPDACRTTCVLPLCGDGVVDSGEGCDDDNKSNADLCLNSCELSFCGDGHVNRNEECDDGNEDNADACPKTCEAARCRDGFVWSGVEACDDGNDNDNDGCDNECAPPPCGNGIVETDEGEECDDGNASNGDDCLNTCRASFCGDGFRQPGEECDDGNRRDDDGCMTSCVRMGGDSDPAPGAQKSSGGCTVGQRDDLVEGWWLLLGWVALICLLSRK